MLLGIPRSARCVQRFDDSLNSAIHITYRISLRSSSMREPRDPLLKVVYFFKGRCFFTTGPSKTFCNMFKGCIIKHRTLENSKGKPTSRKSAKTLKIQVALTDLFSRSTKSAQVVEMSLKGVHMPRRASYNLPTYSIMILPQVHLRKPCYDFYFL